jgi:S1-C subfamily serine protease
MIDKLADISDATAALVARVAGSVVRVEGRRRAASGVAWSADLVVTASHGVDWDDEVEVGLPGGESVRAEVAGRDPGSDVAVVRLRAPAGLAAPEWRDEAPSTGALALTVTRPGRTPRAGLALVARVSPDAWRAPGGARLDRFVELDASLHPGFSGGLVVDLAGRALGVATAGIVRGVALVVPPATLRRVASSILAHGGVRRGYLGVATVPVRIPAPLQAAAGRDGGLLVTAVEDGGPSARAGVLLGDVLLEVDGRPVAHPGDLAPALEEERIGEAASLRLLRAGAAVAAAVTVGVRGERRRA